MKQKSLFSRSIKLLSALLLILSISCAAQNPSLKVFEDWRDTAGTQHTFYKAATKTIPGTIYSVVCGATLNSNGNYDFFIQELNGAGGQIWSYQYDGAGHGDDVATAMDIDGSGNIYVTGTYFESSVDSFNVVTMMFDNTGSLQWTSQYAGGASGVDAHHVFFMIPTLPEFLWVEQNGMVWTMISWLSCIRPEVALCGLHLMISGVVKMLSQELLLTVKETALQQVDIRAEQELTNMRLCILTCLVIIPVQPPDGEQQDGA